MGAETNSSLDTFTEQEILTFLLIIFSPHSTTKFVEKYLIFVLPFFSIQGPVHSNKIM